ncbi:MAG: hypothetical protein KJO38_07135, partial [Gammaproteobacteria bacterium]|nr:hypothetical protein [Gammaproteobacteria bacterium]
MADNDKAAGTAQPGIPVPEAVAGNGVLDRRLLLKGGAGLAALWLTPLPASGDPHGNGPGGPTTLPPSMGRP